MVNDHAHDDTSAESHPRPRAMEGTGLALSGGGFRATLFHAGVLNRLNTAGLLGTIDRYSSVSGGSITAAVLAVAWNDLNFDSAGLATNFDDLVVEPLLALTSRRIDIPAVAFGALVPRRGAADEVARLLDRHLFDGRTLQDLPDEPRFVFNATNLATGVLVRLSKPYLADYKVGQVRSPRVRIATAVTASAAFPPVLSPVTLRFSPADWTAQSGNTHTSGEYRSLLRLTDGGVYDNLALETLWKRHQTVLVSDAGAALATPSRPRRDWLLGTYRVLQVIDNQVRAQRKRHLVASFIDPADPHAGCLISIATPLDAYPPPTGSEDPAAASDHCAAHDTLSVSTEMTERLAAVPTRLTRLPRATQEELINWGFAAADRAVRTYLDPRLELSPLPYPNRPMT